ncbi:MAG: Ldh family oxidoreductase [Acidobacteria bacterium]|nr:MAG: Ldh family oxidoreductase [Acidobacteriota bacterium]REK05931.1 MAG: Ldh family oxidoreductase [Acidobacteriota bacterium]
MVAGEGAESARKDAATAGPETDGAETGGAETSVRVAEAALREAVEVIFVGLGLTAEDAATVADALVEADLMGVSSHGVSNYIQLIYAPGIRAGRIEARPRLEVVRETPVSAVVDGGGGMGHVVGRFAMELAIRKASEVGIGAVAVLGSRHYGAAGHYSHMALAHDMIGLSLTNADKLVVPTHGSESRLGTNPIAVSIPAGDEAPFHLDMATSTVPLGKIMLARRAGQPIPHGWAADATGRSTTDAAAAFEAFRLLPLGGTYELGSHKGYGLAMLVDILSGLLSGAGVGAGGGLGNQVGHFFAAARLDCFRDPDEFKREMDEFLRQMRATPPIEGSGEEVIYAGVKEAAARADCAANGIPLHRDVVAYLDGLADELGSTAPRLGSA